MLGLGLILCGDKRVCSFSNKIGIRREIIVLAPSPFQVFAPGGPSCRPANGPSERPVGAFRPEGKTPLVLISGLPVMAGEVSSGHSLEQKL